MHTPGERQQDAIAAGPAPEARRDGGAARPPPSAAAPTAPRRTNWILVACMGLLLAAFAGLACFQLLLKNRTFENADRLAMLAGAELPQPAPAKTTDWPQWRGPNRDGVSGETNVLTDWPA